MLFCSNDKEYEITPCENRQFTTSRFPLLECRTLSACRQLFHSVAAMASDHDFIPAVWDIAGCTAEEAQNRWGADDLASPEALNASSVSMSGRGKRLELAMMQTLRHVSRQKHRASWPPSPAVF